MHGRLDELDLTQQVEIILYVRTLIITSLLTSHLSLLFKLFFFQAEDGKNKKHFCLGSFWKNKEGKLKQAFRFLNVQAFTTCSSTKRIIITVLLTVECKYVHPVRQFNLIRDVRDYIVCMSISVLTNHNQSIKHILGSSLKRYLTLTYLNLWLRTCYFLPANFDVLITAWKFWVKFDLGSPQP